MKNRGGQERRQMRKRFTHARTRRSRSIPLSSMLLSIFILLLLSPKTFHCNAIRLKSKVKANVNVHDIAVASYRDKYDDDDDENNQHKELLYGKAADFNFQRYQSPAAIKKALTASRGKESSSFKRFQGKDGRVGHVSNTKLGGDWVLAESQQVAVSCTTEDVLRAYLSGDLQQRWNAKEVLECRITKRKNKPPIYPPHSHDTGIYTKNNPWGSSRSVGGTHNLEAYEYYQQDLVLRSQRIIRSHTGVMRYSQTITIDKIGHENYCVSIRLDPKQQPSDATDRKPFESLSVYVGLQQQGDDVNIYAAGVMQVNRKVVPNLVVFDASGIAGSMAGKGTLWLASFFEQRRSSRLL